jgi:hypothetical protein
MSIKRTIITTVVALALVAVVAPFAVNAQTPTVAQLMAQIAQLSAQLQGLQGTTTPAATGTGACAGITFTRNLTVGSTGSDVKCLQTILNESATTQVSTTGAGAPGMETSTFGPKTLVAVKKYQTANGLTPANQVGPMTRAKLNAALSSTVVLPNPNQTTPVVTPTGSISATVASDNPASGAIINSQAVADLLHINFTGTGTVTSVTLQRSGISDQNTLQNVYLFDGNTRITDGYSFNVNGQIVMNGLSIAVNGSHTISVRADVATGVSSSASSIAVAMTGFTGNGSTVTSNAQGNTMMIVAGSAASATLNANTVQSATVNAGVSQYTFWSAPIQVNTRAVLLKTANFRMIGSAPSDALANIKMFIDGVDTGKTATITAINGSTYLSFDLTSAPITLTTGSHTIDVRADVQKGTDRTITISVQQASDITITDPQVGVNIAVGNTPNGTAVISIATGSATVVVDPTFTSQTNISGGATNAVIGRFIIHAYGEDVKVQTLNVIPAILGATAASGSGCTTNATTGVASGTCGLNNVTLYFNGSQVGSQINYSAANGYTMGDGVTTGTVIPFSLGSQVIAPAGQDSVLEVRADLQTSGNYAYNGGTVKVGLPLETANGQGMSSQNTVAVPTAEVATTGLSIQTGQLQVAANSNYLNQNISANTAGTKIGSYVIQNQSTSESIRLTSYSLTTTVSGGSPTTLAINNFSALRTSDTTGSGSTPVQFSGVGTGTTSTDVFSVNDTLAPGATMTVDVFANTGAASSGTIHTTLTVSSIGSVDNIAATSSVMPGQTMTLGSGSVATPTVVVSSTTPSQYIASSTPSGAANSSQATYNFISNSGTSNITELKFTVSDSSSNTSVTNVCVGSVCNQPISGIADLTGLNLTVPNGGGGLTQNVLLSYSGVGTGGLLPGTTSTIALTYVKYTSGGTTAVLGVSPTISIPANQMTLVGSVPTVSISQTSPATGLILGANQLVGQVTVAASSSGDIRVGKITFNVGNSGFASGTSGSQESLTAPYLANGTTRLQYVTCASTGGTGGTSTTAVTCTFNSNAAGTSLGTTGYAYDYPITRGNSQTFNLYATTGGAAATSSTASISSAVAVDTSASSASSSNFLWDDASVNGTNPVNNDSTYGDAGTGTKLNSYFIYNFPTNSYSIHQ